MGKKYEVMGVFVQAFVSVGLGLIAICVKATWQARTSMSIFPK
jgi:hypothetical protein